MNRDEVFSLLLSNRPGFEKREEELICGRVRLKIEKSQPGLRMEHFVYTKASLKLLEQIARCIECREPVLLSGETGVGKTSALQHLARLIGKKVHVINLNQQTETSDLLGSFKPVDIKSQMKILKEKFLELFTKCFSVDENQSFLTHIQVNRVKGNNIQLYIFNQIFFIEELLPGE